MRCEPKFILINIHISLPKDLKSKCSDTWRDFKLEEIGSSLAVCVSTIVKSFQTDYLIVWWIFQNINLPSFLT